MIENLTFKIVHNILIMIFCLAKKWADSCGIIVTKKVNVVSIAFEHLN